MSVILFPTERARLFEEGTRLFNEEQFFEAHEIWEELWKAEKEPSRTWVQGLIQAAGHYVHVRNGNLSGAKSLADSALEKLLRAAKLEGVYMKWDLEPITSALSYNLTLLSTETAPEPEKFLVPKLFPRN